MAKGNLILGTAGNSIGDVVMYRRDGAQVSRVRVRKVANPRTNAQSAQRSFFAPVAKFFSPLSSVLERSWEGLNKSKSYSKFLAENVKLARKNEWLLPKGTGFFPLPYQLSNGTLPPVRVEEFPNRPAFGIYGANMTTVPTTVGDLSSYFIAAGYKANDVVTFIVIRNIQGRTFIPYSFQFEIDAASTITLKTIAPDLLWTLQNETSGCPLFETDLEDITAAAVIVARFEDNKWHRSKQFLVVSEGAMSEVSSDVYKAAAIASYGNAATGENPLVYLDGDELQD